VGRVSTPKEGTVRRAEEAIVAADALGNHGSEDKFFVTEILERACFVCEFLRNH
tara:strand:- start:284 stop:445 length:162 start_codon:yes stop_codon:yes gene_type:complete